MYVLPVVRHTRRIRVWRVLVMACLVATAAVITTVTYRFLRDEQEENFHVAFEQFSRTVSDAAVRTN